MLSHCPILENYDRLSAPLPRIPRGSDTGAIIGGAPTKKRRTVAEVLNKSGPTRISDSERDIYGQNAFLRAVQRKDEAEFSRLLKQRIDSAADDLNCEDYSQRNALILASMSGNESIVKQLLETKVMRVDSQDMAEFTALMYASQMGHQSIVEQLLSIEADYTLCNINGDTAIILAARRNRIDCLKALARFAKSADNWTVEGECGLTAEQWAETNGHLEAAAFIRETIAALNRQDN